MTLGNDNGTDGQTDRQTDRRTDRVRRKMRPPPREEGRIITSMTALPDGETSLMTYAIISIKYWHWTDRQK